MVTVDPTGSDVIDYSDFQTQMVRAFAFYDPNPAPGTPPELSGLIVNHQVEPLAGRGGLGPNEVAELMYLEVDVTLDVLCESGGADFTGHVDGSGIVGINLSNDDRIRESTISGDSTATEVGKTRSSGPVNSPTVTDNDRLQMFEAFLGVGDEVGGGFDYQPFRSVKNFRQTHGRGPVLDANDDISIIGETSTPGIRDDENGAVDIEFEVRLTMYWDIAETSDAGRRFSVPRGL